MAKKDLNYNSLKENFCLEIIEGNYIEYVYYSTVEEMQRAKKKLQKEGKFFNELCQKL